MVTEPGALAVDPLGLMGCVGIWKVLETGQRLGPSVMSLNLILSIIFILREP